MAFEDDFARHVEQIKNRLPYVRGEEATKHSLVVPLLALLGYDVYDPREVLPEYGADFAKKKLGQFEKVDYAIKMNGEPALFVEVKAADVELDNHDAQLSRYFNTTQSVRCGILTNGVRVKVFTDLQSPNIMDDKPWMDFDLRSAKTAEIDAFKKFRKSDFASDQIVGLAEEMLYYNVLLQWVSAQIREPSEPLVRLVAESIPSIKRIDKKIVDRLAPILRKAIQAAILDNVARGLSAPPPIVEEVAPPLPVTVAAAGGAVAPAASVAPAAPEGIVTTKEELEAFALIEKMIREKYADAQVSYRDAKNYFTITQQSNLRKWFIRLGIERTPLWIAFRHVAPDAARALVPGVEVNDGGGLGQCRVTLRAGADIARLKPIILACWEAEAARLSDAGDGGVDPSAS